MQIPFPGHRLVQHRQVYQPILMTLLQSQCHQGFPGSKGPGNFLFFHWWQTPFLPVNKASNPSAGTLWRVTVFCGEEQTLKFVLYLKAASDCWFYRINNLALLSYLEVKHEQVIWIDNRILNRQGRSFWEIKSPGLFCVLRRYQIEELWNQTGIQESAECWATGQWASDVPWI